MIEQLFWHNVHMHDEHALRQIDQARGDLYAISDDLEFIKFQLSRLPTRAYFCRMLFLTSASI